MTEEQRTEDQAKMGSILVVGGGIFWWNKILLWAAGSLS
jgi:hypothetical protein